MSATHLTAPRPSIADVLSGVRFEVKEESVKMVDVTSCKDNDAVGILLIAAPPITLPQAAAASSIDSLVAREGISAPWRNVPTSVRESIASLAESVAAGDARLSALALLVGARAGAAETSAAFKTAAPDSALRALSTAVIAGLEAAAAERQNINLAARIAHARVSTFEAEFAGEVAASAHYKSAATATVATIVASIDAIKAAAKADHAAMRGEIDRSAALVTRRSNEVFNVAAAGAAAGATANAMALAGVRDRIRLLEVQVRDVVDGVQEVGGGGGAQCQRILRGL